MRPCADRHSFLFASPYNKEPTSARKVHLLRLYDILQLSIRRNDMPHAIRAWSILARCPEMNWMSMWTTALSLLGESPNDPRRCEYLRTMMLQYPIDRENILKELVLSLISAGRYKDAKDELDLYMPSFPYQENSLLHIYSGMVSLYLAQGSGAIVNWDVSMLQAAKASFERALALDPGNDVPQTYLKLIPAFLSRKGGYVEPDEDDDALATSRVLPIQRRKKIKT